MQKHHETHVVSLAPPEPAVKSRVRISHGIALIPLIGSAGSIGTFLLAGWRGVGCFIVGIISAVCLIVGDALLDLPWSEK